jgi:hypothetical protein
MKDEIASAMEYANGTFAPAVLVKDYGENYFAWVYRDDKRTYTEAQALRTAQHVIDVKTKGYLNNKWTAYTNAAGTLEWLKDQDFVIED